MSPQRITLVCAASVAGVELMLAALTRTTILGAYFVACAAATVGVAVLVARFTRPRGDGPGGGDGDRGDDGPGGGGGPGDDPAGDPPWWPELEAWLRERDRDRPHEPAGA